MLNGEYKIVLILKKKKLVVKMNNKKRSGILLRVLDKIYQETANMSDYIETCMIDTCKDENVSPNQGFYILLYFLFVANIII